MSRAAAAGSYAAPSDEVPVYAEEELGGYAGDEAGDPALDMLLKSIPGVPGEDYPIYSEVPDTAFICDGQVDGGYYADPEADCQAFHICAEREANSPAGDGQGQYAGGNGGRSGGNGRR